MKLEDALPIIKKEMLERKPKPVPAPEEKHFIIKDFVKDPDEPIKPLFCPCCCHDQIFELIDEDSGGNLFLEGYRCNNCSWDTIENICYQKDYLSRLIKRVEINGNKIPIWLYEKEERDLHFSISEVKEILDLGYYIDISIHDKGDKYSGCPCKWRNSTISIDISNQMNGKPFKEFYDPDVDDDELSNILSSFEEFHTSDNNKLHISRS